MIDPYPWGDLRSFRAVSEGLADAIEARKATENRVKRAEVGDALVGDHMIKMARNLEADYRRMLLDFYERDVPEHVRAWAAEIPGLASGESFARILAAIGHPRRAVPLKMEGTGKARTAVPDGEPYDRTLRQLWQFCGVGDPDRRPEKNMSGSDLLALGRRTKVYPLLFMFGDYLQRQGGNPKVAGSKFYKILAAAREDAAGHAGPCGSGAWPLPCAESHRRHAHECRNHKRPPQDPDGCGTVAHPEWGDPGSPWRPGHIQRHTRRIVAKEFLRDLWVISA